MELAAGELLRDAGSREADLRRTLCVVSGGRAGHLLLGALIEEAEQAGAVLVPPRIVTPGGVAEALGLAGSGPAAGQGARLLAWGEAIERTPRAERAALLPREPAEPGPLRWLGAAELLDETAETLAGAGLRFSDVLEASGTMPAEEAGRWEAASRLATGYERVLATWGLADERLALLDVLGGAAEPPETTRIEQVVLVGVLSLPPVVKRVLERSVAPVTALVYGEQADAELYDEFGCVRPRERLARRLDLDPSGVLFASDARAQAEAAMGVVAGLDGRFAPEEITISAPDAEVLPHLERAAARAGAQVRPAAGRPLAQQAPARLLWLVGELVEAPTFSHTAKLVRHPDVERALAAQLSGGERRLEWWLAAMDRYQEKHLPASLGEEWRTEDGRTLGALQDVERGVRGLVGELLSSNEEQAPLRKWSNAIGGLLLAVYEGEPAPQSPAQRRLVEACSAIAQVLGELEQVGDVACTAGEALRLVCRLCEGRAVAEPAKDDAIEALGWLELLADPAQVVIATGMNEGKVPRRVLRPLLPESLCERLGVETDADRLARDTHALETLLRSKERVTLIGGRRSADGEPLLPSRLLFCGSREQTLAIAEKLAKANDRALPRAKRLERVLPGPQSHFPIRPQAAWAAPEEFPVTSFRTYLASPYLFYLQYVQRLRTAAEESSELDAAGFGSLVHAALEDFTRDPGRDGADERVVREILLDHLHERARLAFGEAPTQAVRMQVMLAERALERFAPWQAARSREGWRIAHAEWPGDGRARPFAVDDAPIGLRGRIDRVDVHEDGRVALLDYKTARRVDPPERTHRGREGWRDLQLPLYRHVAAELCGGGPVQLGYIALCGEVKPAELYTAEWGRRELEEADETAREVVRRVRAGEFGELGRVRAEVAFEDLCGIGVLLSSADAGTPEGEG